jgi:hypothetical protein
VNTADRMQSPLGRMAHSNRHLVHPNNSLYCGIAVPDSQGPARANGDMCGMGRLGVAMSVNFRKDVLGMNGAVDSNLQLFQYLSAPRHSL